MDPVEPYQAFYSTLEKGHFLRVFENIDPSLWFDGELDDTMAEDPGAIAIYLNSNLSSKIETNSKVFSFNVI